MVGIPKNVENNDVPLALLTPSEIEETQKAFSELAEGDLSTLKAYSLLTKAGLAENKENVSILLKKIFVQTVLKRYRTPVLLDDIFIFFDLSTYNSTESWFAIVKIMGVKCRFRYLPARDAFTFETEWSLGPREIKP